MSPGGRVLVTGAAGMLGSQLLLDAPERFEAVGLDALSAARFAELGHGGPPVEYLDFDLTDAAQTRQLLLEEGRWSGVIHAAAYTAVDRAEEEEDLALRMNRDASRYVAEACAAAGVPLVLVSTDFVFDGSAREPYGEDAEPSAKGAYGRTKLAGERAALEAHPGGVRIVRTQWLYGPRGKHFPGTILRAAREKDRLRVVDDQVGSPTSTLELAPALWDVLERGEAGVYHAACEGQASWFDLARATLEGAGVATPVERCTTEEFPRPAPRPAYSVLDCRKLAALRGRTLKPWREALLDWLAAERRRSATA